MQTEAIRIPKFVVKVLLRLEDSGYEAYAVGGCVRDMLIGRKVNDYDVCTSARPEETLRLFPNSIPTGIKHGTVTVRSEGHFIEVTTFRSDGDYTDSRHPDNVQFLDSIEGDLSRRDFTINAVAADIRGNIIDPFDGIADMQRKIIRCVGDPEKRFSEDALRMFRAIRFSAQLGFVIEENTYSAIIDLMQNANKLSAERVRDEIQKILLSPAPGKLSCLIELGLMDSYINCRKPVEAQNICCLQKDAALRWAAVSALMLTSGSINDPGEFLYRLRLDGKTVRNASRGAKIAVACDLRSPYEWKHVISQNGAEAAKCAASCMDVLYETGHGKMLSAVLSSGECTTISELAVNGNDIASLGIQGREIGQVLGQLLEHVIDFPEDNKRDTLLELASQSAHF